MKLSIRTRILGGYSFVIVLFLAVILNIFLTQKSISAKLTLINEEYLPKLAQINTLSNYYHLDETLDVQKIIQNIKNRLFMQNLLVYPALLDKQLDSISSKTQASLDKLKPMPQRRLLSLVLESIKEVKEKHRAYQSILNEAISLVNDKNTKKALALNEKLIKEKSSLRSEISFLRRRLDNNIRSSLLNVSRMEKNASIITTVLSLLSIVIAGTITLFALYTLAPIRKLIEGVKRISLGDYDHKVNIRSEGEMKILAQEFNNMSDSIQERNNALKEQQKMLLQSERMAVIGRMASHITHEVKNPLNSISLNTELLEDELKAFKNFDTKEAFNLLNSMRREIDRLSKISEEYLSFARLPRGERQRTRIESVLKDLTSFLKNELLKNGIELSQDYSETLEVPIDINQMKQAFLNILKNSIEAQPKGGKIAVKTSQEGQRVRITIEDNGPGIPPGEIDKIFDPFFTTKEKGTGLGLPLTQKIITEQGGQISCESSPGKGTRFEILLPTNPKDPIHAHA